MAVACAGGQAAAARPRWLRPVTSASTASAKKPPPCGKLGDVLTIALDNSVRVLKVAGFSERRATRPAARVLYEDLHGRAG